MEYDPFKLRPLGDHIFVLLEKPEEMSGPIHIPEGSLLRPEARAKVISVGRGRVTRKGALVPLDVRPGQTVVIQRLHELTTTQKAIQARYGKGYLIIDPKDILYVEEEDG